LIPGLNQTTKKWVQESKNNGNSEKVKGGHSSIFINFLKIFFFNFMELARTTFYPDYENFVFK
jgi:hypothetical protein